MAISHQNNFATNLTSNVSATDTTSPLNSIPSVAAPFYLAFDATNINGNYEIVYVTSKTATNVLHAALSYDHTTAEEVRMVVPAAELDEYTALVTNLGDGTSSIGLKRQAIINGNFDIWQRGTSFTANNNVTADKWKMGITGTSMTVSRQAFTLGQTEVPNEPVYYLRAATTTSAGAGNYAILQQRIESVRTLAGQTATLSFYAKADASKNISVEFSQVFGTTGSPSATVTGIGVNKISLTTSWAKYSVTVNIDSITGKTLGTDNNDYLNVLFWLDAGSSFDARTDTLGQQSGTFEFSSVQLCAGDTAIPFQPKSYEEELRACQRYCYGVTTIATGEVIGYGPAASTTVATIPISLPVEMRNAPTITKTATDWQLTDTVAAGIDLTDLVVSANQTGKKMVVLTATVAAGLTQYRTYRLNGDGTTGRTLLLDADL